MRRPRKETGHPRSCSLVNDEHVDVSMLVRSVLHQGLVHCGKTQSELARTLGCSPQWINHVFRHGENMTMGTLVQMLNAMDLVMHVDAQPFGPLRIRFEPARQLVAAAGTGQDQVQA